MTISRVGGVFFTAVTTVNGVTRESSEYLGGANVQDPPTYVCFTNNDRTVGAQFYFYNMTGQTSTFNYSTRVSVPSSYSGTTIGVTFSRDNKILAFSSTDTPYLRMHGLTGGTSPFSTLLTNPTNVATDLAGTTFYLSFNPTDTALAIPVGAANCLETYNVTGTTSNPPLGTKLSDPGSGFNGVTRCIGCGWHPNGDYLVIGGLNSGAGSIMVFPVTGSPLGYGTRINVVTTSSDFRQTIFSPKGDMVAGATISPGSPTVQIFPWTGTGVGTRYTNPITFANATAINFSSDQKYVAIGLNASPWLRVYNWTGSTTSDYGFGSQITLPLTLPNKIVREIRWFGINDRYLMMCGGSTGTDTVNIYIWGASGTTGNMVYRIAQPILTSNEPQGIASNWV